MRGRGRQIWNQSLRAKIILSVVLVMAISLAVNLLLFGRINGAVENLDKVYATNIRLSELEQVLTDIQDKVYVYLNTQSDEALELFYTEREQFSSMIGEIDDTITDHPAKRMERNLRNLSISYLDQADRAVEAKKQQDVAGYKENFVEISHIYSYLLAYIRGLDTLRFKTNSESYGVVYQSLRYLEIFMVGVLICAACYLTILLYGIMGSITKPLERLAEKAGEVGRGNLQIKLEEPKYEDEVGTVTRAFNQMIVSINEYIRKTRESMELEIQMKERELAMENLLKDAQLKYYQAQINPHFLFNTLNAGQQLAMMEDAEKTYDFMENLALFFRYRLKKNGEESTMQEEIDLVDSYMYIMNVRYSGEIHLEKELDERLLSMRFPGMILQPIVENALRYGLSGIEREKKIRFIVYQENELAYIKIRDNGVGISQEVLRQIREGISQPEQISGASPDSGNGVGLKNVRARLQLYYEREDVLTVESEGLDQGTEVTICVPIRKRTEEGEKHV